MSDRHTNIMDCWKLSDKIKDYVNDDFLVVSDRGIALAKKILADCYNKIKDIK